MLQNHSFFLFRAGGSQRVPCRGREVSVVSDSVEDKRTAEEAVCVEFTEPVSTSQFASAQRGSADARTKSADRFDGRKCG